MDDVIKRFIMQSIFTERSNTMYTPEHNTKVSGFALLPFAVFIVIYLGAASNRPGECRWPSTSSRR